MLLFFVLTFWVGSFSRDHNLASSINTYHALLSPRLSQSLHPLYLTQASQLSNIVLPTHSITMYINVTRRGTYLFELHPTILPHHRHRHSISPLPATSCQYRFQFYREPTRLPFSMFLFPTSPSSNIAHSVFDDPRQLLLIQHNPGGYSRDPREFKRKTG